MSQNERGIANPTIDVLERIAKVLGAKMAELFVVPQLDEEGPKPLRCGRRTKG